MSSRTAQFAFASPRNSIQNSACENGPTLPTTALTGTPVVNGSGIVPPTLTFLLFIDGNNPCKNSWESESGPRFGEPNRQGLCQAAARSDSETTAVETKPMLKLADDRASSIAVGADRNEVLQKLGEPYSRISGDFERFTYQLKSGGTLSIESEGGRVTKVYSTVGH